MAAKIQWNIFKEGTFGSLSERITITFHLDHESTIDIKLRDNKLIVTTSDRLEIEPRAANQVYIRALLNPRS